MRPTIINEDDYAEKFWKHDFEVWVGPHSGPYIINADHEQDALDYLIDWAEENAPGLLFDQEEEAEEEFLDDYYCGGNHGRYLSETEISIKTVR